MTEHVQASVREVKRLDSISRSPVYSSIGEALTGLATIRAFRAEERLAVHNAGLVDDSAVMSLVNMSLNRCCLGGSLTKQPSGVTVAFRLQAEQQPGVDGLVLAAIRLDICFNSGDHEPGQHVPQQVQPLSRNTSPPSQGCLTCTYLLAPSRAAARCEEHDDGISQWVIASSRCRIARFCLLGRRTTAGTQPCAHAKPVMTRAFLLSQNQGRRGCLAQRV